MTNAPAYYTLVFYYKSVCLIRSMLICPSVRLSVSPSVRLSICPFVHLSVPLSICVSVRPSIHRFVCCIAVCLFIRPSVHTSICLSACLSVRPSVCLSRLSAIIYFFCHALLHSLELEKDSRVLHCKTLYGRNSLIKTRLSATVSATSFLV